MREIGSIREFDDGIYEVVEDNIIPEKKKKSFILLLNLEVILFIIVLGVLSLFIFGTEFSVDIDNTTDIYIAYAGLAGVLFSFLLYVVIHELLHGWAFKLFNKNSKQQLKFGIIFKSGMAYCISTIPVKVDAARLSLMMPIYVICLPMYIIAIITQTSWLGYVAVLFASGSVGDFYYMWKLRKTSKDLYMYEEMPTKSGYEVGYVLYKKIESAN